MRLSQLKENVTLIDNEKIFNILSFIILALVLITPTFKFYQNSLSDDHPCCFVGTDSFVHYGFIDFISQGGGIDKSPTYIAHTTYDAYTDQPPLYYSVVAVLILLTGFKPYQIVFAFAVLILLNSILLFYIWIRKYDFKLAFFSIPFIFLMFLPFYSRILEIGQWVDNYGILLMISGLFITSLYLEDKLVSRKLFLTGLTILISALMLSHTEWVYFFFTIALYFFFRMTLKREELKFKKAYVFGLGLAISLLIAGPYLIKLFVKAGTNSIFNEIKFSSRELVGMSTSLSNLGFLYRILLFGGLLIILYRLFFKRDYNLVILTSLSMFLLGYSYFIGFGRANEIRYFWPILISPFFGTALKQLINLIKNSFINFFLTYSSVIALLFLFFLSFNLQPSIFGVEKDMWNGVEWIRTNTDKYDTILFVLPERGNFYDKLSWFTYRYSYYTSLNQIINETLNGSKKMIYHEPVYWSALEKKGILNYTKIEGRPKAPSCAMSYLLINNKILVPNIVVGRKLMLGSYNFTIDAFLNNKNFNLTFNEGNTYVFKQISKCR